MCNICEDTGTVKMVPEAVGWVHQHGSVWKMPDGRLFEFPPNASQLLVAMCPDCHPSVWPKRYTLN